MMIPLPPEILTRPASFAATRMLAWSVGSQHHARRNAMVAATACAQRRAQREDVADYLARRGRRTDAPATSGHESHPPAVEL